MRFISVNSSIFLSIILINLFKYFFMSAAEGVTHFKLIWTENDVW